VDQLAEKPRGRLRRFQEKASDLLEELGDDVSIRSVQDLQREIREDVLAVKETGKAFLELGEALTDQIIKGLPKMSPEQLLFLALKAAEFSGDTSFLKGWKVIAESDGSA
jgi:hypothetical protein